MLTNSEYFLSKAVSVDLIGINSCWNQSFHFPEGSHNRGLPSNSTINITSPLDEDQPLMWLVVVHFACPMICSISHYYMEYTVHRPSHFVLKMEVFVTFKWRIACGNMVKKVFSA